jgi:hypothetical protein
MEALKDPRKFGFWDAGATVRDAQSSVAVLCGETDVDPAVERQFEGVRNKIEYDLLPHLVIDEHRLGQRGHFDD